MIPFCKFCLVGVLNTATTFVVYGALLAVGVPYLAAAAAGFLAGAAIGYSINRRWTFRARDSLAAKARYLAVQAAALAVTLALLRLLVDDAGLGAVAAELVVVPLVAVVSFALNRAWTFGSPGRLSASNS